MKTLRFRTSFGFTLVELLVVMGVMAITGALVVAVTLDSIKQAGDAAVFSQFAFMGKVTDGYALAHGGFYPASFQDLVDSGAMSTLPNAPDGYSYSFSANPQGCTAGVSCTSVVFTSPLKSFKYLTTPYARYESATGKVCFVATATTSCP